MRATYNKLNQRTQRERARCSGEMHAYISALKILLSSPEGKDSEVGYPEFHSGSETAVLIEIERFVGGRHEHDRTRLLPGRGGGGSVSVVYQGDVSPRTISSSTPWRSAAMMAASLPSRCHCTPLARSLHSLLTTATAARLTSPACGSRARPADGQVPLLPVRDA